MQPTFVPLICPNPTNIGINCNISSAPCDILNPCQNSATCTNSNMTLSGYICLCSFGFYGIQCELDYRPCKPNTCWHNGTHFLFFLFFNQMINVFLLLKVLVLQRQIQHLIVHVPLVGKVFNVKDK